MILKKSKQGTDQRSTATTEVLEDYKNNIKRLIFVPHPLSVVFSSKSFDRVVWNKPALSKIKDAYLAMSLALSSRKNKNVPQIDGWGTFLNKFCRGRQILTVFGERCNEYSTSAKSPPSAMQFAADHLEFAEILTTNLTSKTLTEEALLEAITTNSIQDVLYTGVATFNTEENTEDDEEKSTNTKTKTNNGTQKPVKRRQK